VAMPTNAAETPAHVAPHRLFLEIASRKPGSFALSSHESEGAAPLPDWNQNQAATNAATAEINCSAPTRYVNDPS
jgi:hypothetical protein